MALPATDTFTAAVNTPLATYSSSWTVNSGGYEVFAASDAVSSTASGENCAHWNADVFSNDQYSQATIIDPPFWHGVSVRCHASAQTFYQWYGDGSDSQLAKVISGAWTQLGSNATGILIGTTIRLEANGTTLTPYKNGSTTATPGAQTDSSITSGYAGITSGLSISGGILDNWEGGNLGGAAAASLFPPRRQRTYLRM